jgi:hypothetical protein
MTADDQAQAHIGDHFALVVLLIKALQLLGEEKPGRKEEEKER